jgi:hypothetical protein
MVVKSFIVKAPAVSVMVRHFNYRLIGIGKYRNRVEKCIRLHSSKPKKSRKTSILLNVLAYYTEL